LQFHARTASQNIHYANPGTISGPCAKWPLIVPGIVKWIWAKHIVKQGLVSFHDPTYSSVSGKLKRGNKMLQGSKLHWTIPVFWRRFFWPSSRLVHCAINSPFARSPLPFWDKRDYPHRSLSLQTRFFDSWCPKLAFSCFLGDSHRNDVVCINNKYKLQFSEVRYVKEPLHKGTHALLILLQHLPH